MRTRALASAAIAGVAAWTAAAAQTPAPASSAPPATAPAVGGGAPAASAVGDVNLTPRRLVFSGRQRSGEVIVFNRGNARAVYRVELEDLAMNAAGGLEPLDRVDPAIRARHRSAKETLRYSPRRVELEPGGSQVIRVLARGDAAGETRAHLVVTSVPTEGAGLDVADAVAPTARELRVRITPIFGISIPIITRSGDLAAQVAFENARIVRDGGATTLTATLRRSGDRSVYGDVGVTQGDRTIGELKGVAVYPEIDTRTVSIPLDGAGAGPVRVTFRDAEGGAGSAILAQADVSG